MWWKTVIQMTQFLLPPDYHCLLEECVFTLYIQLLVIITTLTLGIWLGWGVTHGRQRGSANQWWRPFGSSGEHMLQHWCRNTHSLLHGCSHRCPPGSSYRTMWHLPTEHQTPLNTEIISHSLVHFDSVWMLFSVISLPQGGRLGTLHWAKSHTVFLQRVLEEDSDCRGALYQDCSHTNGTFTHKQTHSV